ncbi:MAG: helical backbone metal receptor [Actinomycetota bacterium]|jgi:ABC-type Fe3+-hydroxamate transport system substrate-binding protein|nr:ABC transporter substrate-binding protein [Rubrobacter sp.]MDQ3509931.1 helical backbone metal receptor [Actinomycetota bacterium]
MNEPRRIISLVPSLTEALFVFGVGEHVVGRTNYCEFPPRAVRRAEKVGGTKKVDVGKALALEPDLVVAVKEENSREDVEAFREAGVPVFLGEPETVDGAVSMLRELADMVHAPNAAPTIEAVERVRGRLREELPRNPRRVFAPIWKSPYMAVGGDTYVSDVIGVCGGENVFGGRTRYPEVSLEEVEERQPEVVLLPDEPYVFSAVDLTDFSSLDIPAARDDRIHLVDGKLLTWYGPRMATSLSQISALFATD